MKKTEVITLPVELNELAVKVSSSKQEEVQSVLQQIFIGTDDWEKQIDSIEIKGIEDKMGIELAEVARKNSKQARLNAEKIFDAKREEVKNLKAEFDLEDKLWLKAKQIMQIKFKAIEEKAEWKANYIKRHEAEQKELIIQKRINEVQKYAEINRVEFESMSDQSFESFLNGLKSSYEAKIEAERIAEEERVAKVLAEEKIREEQRIENERLKAEAEKMEKQIQQERLENEKRLAEEAAKAKALQIERDRIEAELQAKKEAELKAEKDKKQLELKLKIEAEKLSKAPIQKQMLAWVNGFSIDDINIENNKTVLIKGKFEAFKNWAKKEVEDFG
jgi:colicin import membrane protein